MINKKNTCSVLDIKLKKMKDIKFNKNLFVPMKTKTIVDSILSTEGGVFPGTNTIVIGDPGVGKSTVLLDWIANLNASGKKVLFISGEMNEIDMYGYVNRYPKFGKLPIMFMSDYSNCPKEAVEQVIDQGYDRRGAVGEKIYFDLGRGGCVDYSFENIS
jgi:predicted ATP-dependent serine protease